ncbi:MAG: isoleucine--tRNA ligase [Candidatus Magasanikbacteria bacterium]|nr:isoleucine--tRNA ligase [Candidatus Magasanikbacteria bacterium]
MYNSTQEENKILKYWDEHKCFEKSVENRPKDKEYSFYDGPPYATGTPHYGHLVASLMKDIVPRYFTMRGFRVERRWGWDCHGLPVENIIERQLRLKNKKDIEKYGIDKFNEACRATVMTYANEWKHTINRMGRWVDMENDYKTMDINFMESVWWVFKQIWDKGLIYKGHKPMHICPRCETPLSNFEVTQGYQDVEDISVTVRFKAVEPEKMDFYEEYAGRDLYILAWTTTPWTLPGNVLLAVNERVDYALVEIEGEEGLYILSLERAPAVLHDKKYKVLKESLGRDLVGLSYEPLFPYFKETPKAFRVVAADFVTVEDGAGVVHIAPAFGEDDFNIGEREGLPLVQHVGMDGLLLPSVEDFAGLEVKPKGNPKGTDLKIVDWLKENGKLFGEQKIRHSYPHCWRCDTPLLNYATASWFIRVTDFKQELLDNNQHIHWVPEHIKEGRFGQWLEGARDWAISRNRFWGTPLPIWQAEDGEALCVGSVEELEELSGKKVTDLHKHIVDKIVIKKSGKEFIRVPEVLDVWFDSGSMPYAQMHYPFENKEKVERNYPAEFIAEGQDQTRGWFYTLHVLAAALTHSPNPSIPVDRGQPAFKNCIVNGTVLAEDGKKMSKRLKNYPEPDILLDKFGADAVRYYLAVSPVMEAENLNFSEVGVKEAFNKLINTLWNVVEFYKLYAENGGKKENEKLKIDNVLDKWIIAKLNILIGQVTQGMEGYRIIEASRPIGEFVTELSQWYVRRSRDRFKSGDENDKEAALATLREVLLTLSKVMAPFTPFIAERIYLDLGGKEESVHLDMWPEADNTLIDEIVINDMITVRKVVELGLATRAEKTLKVRQPLAKLIINNEQLSEQMRNIIAEELNVKAVEAAKELPSGENWAEKEDGALRVALDTQITEELKNEGLVREFVRTVNQMRKEMKLTVNDEVKLVFSADSDELKKVIADYEDKIKASVLATGVSEGDASGGVEADVAGFAVLIKISR